MAERLYGDYIFTGNVELNGTGKVPASSVTNANVAATAAIDRSKLAQDAVKPYPIRLTDCRVWDAPQSLLPTAAANDDLGLVAGTFGTDAPTIQSQDSKADELDGSLRFFFPLPAEYDPGQTINVRVSAGMLTTISDGAAVLDCFVYKHDREGGIGSDLCGTEFQSINSLTFDDIDFAVIPTGLVAGDMLDIRLIISILDTSTVTAVIGCIGAIEVLCDVKG